MYDFLQTFHSYWAYLALILLIIAGVNGLIGFFSKKVFTPRDRKISLFAMIAAHIQLVIGIVLLFTSPYWSSFIEAGMGEAMGNDLLRLYVIEHPVTNILAIGIITFGWSKHKRVEADPVKFRYIGFLYIAGLLLLLSRLPWSAWLS